MNTYVQRMAGDDFLWSAILGAITGRKKRTGSSFISICCPMCIHNGEPTPDVAFKCGVINNSPGVGVHCFRCGFKSLWKPGDGISKRMRDFMQALGMADIEIKRLNHRALQYRRLVEGSGIAVPEMNMAVSFNRVALPSGAKSFRAWAEEGCVDPNFISVVEYLFERGEDIANNYEFYWTPDPKNEMNRRVIIPFYRGDDLVGWTARVIDGGIPEKYRSEVQPDYLFNNRVMLLRDRQYVIVVEGVLDALAIDGVATLGAKMTEKQIHWLKNCGKDIIVVPDRDGAGSRLIDIAIAHDWKVAFPAIKGGHNGNWWDEDVKDVAQAVRRYGRLYTLCSILQTSTKSRVEIALKQKMMKR